MKLAVVGTGYVGLVTGSCLASLGNDVTCIDIDTEKIALLQQGRVPFYEPGLEDIIKCNQEAGRLRFTTSLAEGLKDALVCLISVGTPCDVNGSADLKYVLGVAAEIGRTMEEYKLIVTKSTVPVGTADKVRETIHAEMAKRGLEITFDLASNPEFLREGAAVADFMHPDRVVIGVDNAGAEEVMLELYSFVPAEKIFLMDIRSAEMTKYAANAFLATKISFMNEIANICERVGADVEKVRIGLGSDSRIGYAFTFPGCGYGGSCFPKDVRALEQVALEHGYQPSILPAVENVNNKQKRILFEKMQAFFGELRGKTIAIWGLSFKPNTSDMREASSLVLIQELLEAGAYVRAHDPAAIEEAEKILSHERLSFCKEHYNALKEADALALVTEWDLYRQPDFKLMRQLMRRAVVFDGRNQYSPPEVAKWGFSYVGIGRPNISNKIIQLPPFGMKDVTFTVTEKSSA